MTKSRKGVNAVRMAEERRYEMRLQIKQKWHNIGLWSMRFLYFSICISLIAGLVLSAGFFYHQEGGLQVQKIIVEGQDYLSKEDVLVISEIEKGDFVGDVSFDSIYKSLNENIWVRSVLITWEDTETIRIIIEENEVVARMQKKEWGVLLSNGEWIIPENRVYNLPIIQNNTQMNQMETAYFLTQLKLDSPNDFEDLEKIIPIGMEQYQLKFKSWQGKVLFSAKQSLTLALHRLRKLKKNYFTDVAMAEELDLRFNGFVYLR
jgi:cell division septal protein FtsQ